MTSLKAKLDLAEAKLLAEQAKYAKLEKACNRAYNAYAKLNEQYIAEELTKGDNISLLLNSNPYSKVAWTRLEEICNSYGLGVGGTYVHSGQYSIIVKFDKLNREVNDKQIEGLNFFLPYIKEVTVDDDTLITKDNQSLVGCKQFGIYDYTDSSNCIYSGAIAPNGDVLLIKHRYGTRTVKNVGTWNEIINNHYLYINGKRYYEVDED